MEEYTKKENSKETGSLFAVCALLVSYLAYSSTLNFSMLCPENRTPLFLAATIPHTRYL
jgi:hypothetical protein